MPTYPYACTVCDHRFEVVQSFTDDALTVCPQCSGRLRKVFGSVGVVFKGSGFYRTDSRSTTSSSSAPSHSHNGTSHDTHAGKDGAHGDKGSTASKDGGSKAPAAAAAGGSSSSTSSASSAA
jgi:putative FmdB family regulatory protein